MKFNRGESASRTNRLFAYVLSVTAIVVLSLSAPAFAIVCGDTITVDTTLNVNLTCPAGTGLTITGIGRTLNLNGHKIIGQGTGAIGINVPPPNANVTITNGSVEGFVVGIQVGLANTAVIETSLTRITNVNVKNSVQDGIRLGSAPSTLIQNVNVSGTGTGAGIFAEDSNGSLVLDSKVQNSNSVGVEVLDDDMDVDTASVAQFFIDSSTISNANIGVRATEAAVVVREGSTISGCPTCAFGILSDLGNFTSLSPTPGGVQVSDSTIKKFSRAGIAVTGNFLLADVTISNTTVKSIGNLSGNTLGGIVFDRVIFPAVLSSTVRNVTQGFGIAAYCSAFGAFRDNNIKAADFDGILLQEQGGPGVCDLNQNHGSHLIDGNVLKNNGLSGIFVFADSQNRILNNTIKGNGDHGMVLVDGIDHTVDGNSSKGNTSSGFFVMNVADTLIQLNQARSNGNDGFELVVGNTTTLTSNESSKNTDWGFSTTTAINDGGGNVATGNGGGQCNPAHMSC